MLNKVVGMIFNTHIEGNYAHKLRRIIKMKKGSTLQLINTFVKIKAEQNTDKDYDLAELTFELSKLLEAFPEAEQKFRQRTEMFYQMSLGTEDYNPVTY